MEVSSYQRWYASWRLLWASLICSPPWATMALTSGMHAPASLRIWAGRPHMQRPQSPPVACRHQAGMLSKYLACPASQNAPDSQATRTAKTRHYKLYCAFHSHNKSCVWRCHGLFLSLLSTFSVVNTSFVFAALSYVCVDWAHSEAWQEI